MSADYVIEAEVNTNKDEINIMIKNNGTKDGLGNYIGPEIDNSILWDYTTILEVTKNKVDSRDIIGFNTIGENNEMFYANGINKDTELIFNNEIYYPVKRINL